MSRLIDAIKQLIPGKAEAKPPTIEEDLPFLAEQPCYDINDRDIARHLDEVRTLLLANKIHINRSPKYTCETQTSTMEQSKMTDDGIRNVAYATSIAIPCPNPAHLSTHEYHGGLTQAVIAVESCLKHGPDLEYFERCQEDRFRVIASTRVFRSVDDALVHHALRETRT